MLPSTCLLASQRERIEAKRYEKQRAFAEEMRDALLEVRKAGATALASSLPSINSGVGLCGILSLSTWGPDFSRRWRIERHLKSVVVDDELLTKEGMGDRLTHPELREALWERGIATDGLDKSTLKARIRWWLTMADKTDEGTPVSRRIALVAQGALGQFQVRVVP
jgi:LETM1 and EF-hand domain-containing protein 1